MGPPEVKMTIVLPRPFSEMIRLSPSLTRSRNASQVTIPGFRYRPVTQRIRIFSNTRWKAFLSE